METRVRVNRNQPPVYAAGAKTKMHPVLETKGPSEYGLSEIYLYHHGRQANMEGCSSALPLDIYNHLKQTGLISSCLTLRDGEELVRVAPAEFCKHFPYQGLVLWASVVQFDDGSLRVPYVSNQQDSLSLRWHHLKTAAENVQPFDKRHPAAFFKY